MNYIEWCELVLLNLDAESDRNDYVRNYGIDSGRLEKLVWSEHYDEIKEMLKEAEYQDVLDDAVFDFERLGLIKDGSAQHQKLTLSGRAAAKNIPALWAEICKSALPPTNRKVLETVNRLSEKAGAEFARVQMIDEHEIRTALGDVDETLSSLNENDFSSFQLCGTS